MKPNYNRKNLIIGITAVFLGLSALISGSFADISGSLDEKSTIERIKPVGEVNVEGGPAKSELANQATSPADVGQQHYENICKMCHESGLAGAPKFGDKKDWAPRVAEGIETLVKHALEGYKAMPAKGGCMDCSDEDIKKTVEYMVSKVK